MNNAVHISALALMVATVTFSVLDLFAQTRRSEKLEVWADRAHKTALLVALVVVITLGALIVRIAWVGR